MTNKVLMYVVGGIFVLGLSVTYLMQSRCEVPKDATVWVMTATCFEDMTQDIDAAASDLCVSNGLPRDCDTSQISSQEINKFINERITQCVAKKLSASGMCTDDLDKKMWKGL